MRAVAEWQVSSPQVDRLYCDGQAILAEPMRDGGLERAGPAGLRMDAYPIGHRIRLVVHQDPGDIAREPVTGVVSSRFGQRKLLGDPVEGVAAVANSIRPWDQILSPPATDLVLYSEAVDHIPAADREAAQCRADLGDNGSVISSRDLVLLSGGCGAHELALYRQGPASITLGLLCRP